MDKYSHFQTLFPQTGETSYYFEKVDENMVLPDRTGPVTDIATVEVMIVL